MANFELNVSWTVIGKMVVEADSLDAARQKVPECPLPDGEYLEDSLQADYDDDFDKKISD